MIPINKLMRPLLLVVAILRMRNEAENHSEVTSTNLVPFLYSPLNDKTEHATCKIHIGWKVILD